MEVVLVVTVVALVLEVVIRVTASTVVVLLDVPIVVLRVALVAIVLMVVPVIVSTILIPLDVSTTTPVDLTVPIDVPLDVPTVPVDVLLDVPITMVLGVMVAIVPLDVKVVTVVGIGMKLVMDVKGLAVGNDVLLVVLVTTGGPVMTNVGGVRDGITLLMSSSFASSVSSSSSWPPINPTKNPPRLMTRPPTAMGNVHAEHGIGLGKTIFGKSTLVCSGFSPLVFVDVVVVVVVVFGGEHGDAFPLPHNAPTQVPYKQSSPVEQQYPAGKLPLRYANPSGLHAFLGATGKLFGGPQTPLTQSPQQSIELLQQYPSSDSPSSIPSAPVIQLRVGVGVIAVIVVFAVVTIVIVVVAMVIVVIVVVALVDVILPPVHIYESPGTNVQSPIQSLTLLQQNPSGPFLRFLP